MKYLPILAVGLWLFCQCGGSTPAPKPTIPEAQKRSCTAAIRPLVMEGNNYYYLVTDFQPKNADCYQYIREYTQEVAPNLTKPCTLHFLDNLPDFKPSGGGMYGSESVRKKVIAQCILLPSQSPEIAFDPMGAQQYIEPTQ